MNKSTTIEFNYAEYNKEFSDFLEAKNLKQKDVASLLGVGVHTVTRSKVKISHKFYTQICMLFDGFNDIEDYKNILKLTIRQLYRNETNEETARLLGVTFNNFDRFMYGKDYLAVTGLQTLRADKGKFLVQNNKLDYLDNIKQGTLTGVNKSKRYKNLSGEKHVYR